MASTKSPAAFFGAVKNFFQLDPLTERRFFRFRTIKRSYNSLKILIVLILLSLVAELFVNNRALLVSYEKKIYFPTYGRIHLGTEFGFDYKSEVDYRMLKKTLRENGKGWVVLPLIPYNAFEQDSSGAWRSDSTVGRTKIGLAFNKQQQKEGMAATEYIWTATDDPEGIPLGASADGTPLYVWIKYADNPSGDFLTDFLSSNHKYLGLAFGKTEREESTEATDYTWYEYGGSNKGIAVGKDGKEEYVWVKFADTAEGLVYPPTPPSFKDRHFLGTDRIGRDVFARLFYGFRIAILFALAYVAITYFIGVLIGVLMGYLGGIFDILFQRLIEIWDLIPFLYVVMILTSILKPDIMWFLVIFVVFGWTGMTYASRAMTYRERERDYILAARSMGASTWRIATVHIIPNILVVVLTSLPFAINGAISQLTALDFLGFGLTPPTPSWGELLQVGLATFKDFPWIFASVIVAMVGVLLMVTFIGEGLRDAFDPKKYTVYK